MKKSKNVTNLKDHINVILNNRDIEIRMRSDSEIVRISSKMYELGLEFNDLTGKLYFSMVEYLRELGD